jgi:signal transduction histidine kinase
VLALVATGVFAAGALLSLLSRSTLLALDQAVGRERRLLASSISASVGGALDNELRLLATAAAAPRVDPDDGDAGPEIAALAAVHPAGRLWSSVFVVSADGRVVAAMPAKDAAILSLADARSAIDVALASQRPAVSNIVADGSGHRYVLWLMPFGGAERARGLVAAVAALPARPLADLLQPDTLGADGWGELLDGGGRVIARSGREPVERDVRAEAGVGNTPWTVAIWRPPDSLGSLETVKRRSLWLLPAITIVATLLGWGIVRSVRGPLGGLLAAAERITAGNLAHPVAPPSDRGVGDDVARLGAALERMRASLHTSIGAIESANRRLESRVAERTRELQIMNEQLRERERVRQHLLRKVISAQEDERKRIARELHDETSQTLAALGMRVDAALTEADDATGVRLRELKQFVGRMDDELHRLIVNLRPSVLDDLGLAAAIKWLADRQLAAQGISVRCEVHDLDVRMPPEIETALFRSVQEAISNVARHSNAESVLIQGTFADDGVRVEIEDDGIGFDPAAANGEPGSARGIGVLGMAERMEIVGGTLTIDSEPGAGTRVAFEVPCALDPAHSQTDTAAAVARGGEPWPEAVS